MKKTTSEEIARERRAPIGIATEDGKFIEEDKEDIQVYELKNFFEFLENNKLAMKNKEIKNLVEKIKTKLNKV